MQNTHIKNPQDYKSRVPLILNIIVYNSTINNITTQTQHISHGSVNSVSGIEKFGFDIFGSRYFLPKPSRDLVEGRWSGRKRRQT